MIHIFSRAIRLYGWDNLVKEVIREGLSTEAAYLIEASLRPTLNIGWNILAGGQAKQNGVKRSAATCKKIGDTHRGLVWTKEMIAKKPSASGPNNANFKGFIKCTNKATGDSFLVSSIKEMKDNGFTFGQVYNCLAGTRKTHKGFTFERIK